MGRFYRLVAWTLSLLVLTVLVGASWIIVSPPALLSVGSGYAAKIVCSNVFLAGRDPGKTGNALAGRVLAADQHHGIQVLLQDQAAQQLDIAVRQKVMGGTHRCFPYVGQFCKVREAWRMDGPCVLHRACLLTLMMEAMP